MLHDISENWIQVLLSCALRTLNTRKSRAHHSCIHMKNPSKIAAADEQRESADKYIFFLFEFFDSLLRRTHSLVARHSVTFVSNILSISSFFFLFLYVSAETLPQPQLKHNKFTHFKFIFLSSTTSRLNMLGYIECIHYYYFTQTTN